MSAAVSVMPEDFKAWLKNVKEVQAVRESTRLESNNWWKKTALPLRGYLLAQSGVDDAGRFIDSPWGSLPDGLRCSIVLNTKSLDREISGCGWL